MSGPLWWEQLVMVLGVAVILIAARIALGCLCPVPPVQDPPQDNDSWYDKTRYKMRVLTHCKKKNKPKITFAPKEEETDEEWSVGSSEVITVERARRTSGANRAERLSREQRLSWLRESLFSRSTRSSVTSEGSGASGGAPAPRTSVAAPASKHVRVSHVAETSEAARQQESAAKTSASAKEQHGEKDDEKHE